MGKVLIWFVIIISTVVLYCLMKVKAESDELYEELMKQNKEVQKLKHDMKHKLHELYHLVENSDGHELSEKSLDNLFATKYVEIIE